MTTGPLVGILFMVLRIENVMSQFCVPFQATPCGHALLLGTDYCTGRATLVRLAAHIANCKVSIIQSFLW